MAVHSWGGGASGALGTGLLKEEPLPVVIEGALRGKHVVGVSCGELHSLAVDDLGNVYAWGRNREGQCGQGTLTVAVPTPQRVTALAHERIVKVAAGSHQSTVITDDGRLFRFGLFHQKREELSNTPAFFGLTEMSNLSDAHRAMIERSTYMYFANKSTDEAVDEDEMHADVNTVGAFRRVRLSVPEQVALPEGARVVDVAVGYCFYLIATADGALYTFGFNDKGQLGLGDRFTREAPVRVTTLEGHRVVRVAAGQQHAAAVTDGGKLFTWGGGTFGIGHGDVHDLLTPRQVEALDEHFVEAVSCGAHHTFCLARGSRVFSFGHGEYGQQGTGDFGAVGERNRNLLLPREFHLPYDPASGGAPPSIVITITCGHLHTLFGLADGSVWSCGWGVDGVLGHGDKKYRAIPTPVRALEGERVQHLASGWRHNLIVKATSTTFAFDFGQRMGGTIKRDLSAHVLTTPMLSDVTFVVENKPIRAHRVMVAARCARLAAMLAFHARFSINGMAREDPWRIPIPGVRFVVFQAFLTYLYTDHLKVARYFAPDVLVLAQRFHVPRLEALCRQLMDSDGVVVTVLDSSFAGDLGAWVGEPRYADIEFRIPINPADPDAGRLSVRAHKALLLCRSGYFRNLLRPDGGFNDADNATITLDGCPFDAETFMAVLLHLYSGRRDVVQPETALAVLAAADFFMLDDLMQVAEGVVQDWLQELGPVTDLDLWRDCADAAQSFHAVRLAAFCARHLEPASPEPASAA